MTCDICGGPTDRVWRVRRTVNSDFDVSESFDAGECCTDEDERAVASCTDDDTPEFRCPEHIITAEFTPDGECINCMRDDARLHAAGL